MMELLLIRHGQTKSNREKRYLGRTDERLLTEEKETLMNRREVWGIKWQGDILYTSPMKRCLETAEILFPHQEQRIIADFKEADFGVFEGHTYQELSGNTAYQRFIDSNGNEGFPEGESIEKFRNRCVKAFRFTIEDAIEQKARQIIYVLHGGVIMAILARYADGQKNFYDYQLNNGEAYLVTLDEKCWSEGRWEFHAVKRIGES